MKRKRRRISSNTEEEEVDSDDGEWLPPGDTASILRRKDPYIYRKFIEVREELERREPDINNILSADITMEDKVEIVQLFEVYKMINKPSEEAINMANRLNRMLKSAVKKYKQTLSRPSVELDRMKKEEEKMKQYIDVDLKRKIFDLETSFQNKEIIYSKYLEMKEMTPSSEEYHKLKLWLNWAVSLPYDRVKEFPFNNVTRFLAKVRREMDKNLYGMQRVKEQILLFLNARISNPNMKNCSLSLVGPPGTGKTKIARLLASILHLPFEQISFGGISSASFLIGHEMTFIGAGPGALVRKLKEMKYKNGVLYMDEYDKITDKGVISSLLHITDPSQNVEFRDMFLRELVIDISGLWLIKSMNERPSDPALRDRGFYVEVSGYNPKDKKKIVVNYLLPSILSNINLSQKCITLNDDAVDFLVNTFGAEDEGVRKLEKKLINVVNKIHFLYEHQDSSITKGMTFSLKKKVKYPFVCTRDLLRLFV